VIFQTSGTGRNGRDSQEGEPGGFKRSPWGAESDLDCKLGDRAAKKKTENNGGQEVVDGGR